MQPYVIDASMLNHMDFSACVDPEETVFMSFTLTLRPFQVVGIIYQKELASLLAQGKTNTPTLMRRARK